MRKATKQLTSADLVQSDVVFIESEHVYYKGIDRLSGVTKMLDDVFGSKYTDIDREVLQRAADRGTATHIAIQCNECKCGDEVGYINDYPAFVDAAIQNMYAWLNVRHEGELADIRSICAEYLVSNDKDLASKIDLVMQGKDKTLYLADIKTSSVLDVERTTWQLSVYAYLFMRQTAYKVSDRALIIHVRDGVCQPVWVQLKTDEEVAALIADWRAGVKRTQVVEQKNVPAELVMLGEIYADMERAVLEATARRNEFRDKMLVAMTEAGLYNVQSEDFACTLVAASTRVTYDTARMMREHAELADLFGEYRRETQVKQSIRISVK